MSKRIDAPTWSAPLWLQLLFVVGLLALLALIAWPAEVPMTVGAWAGCEETIYVYDPQAKRVRKLQRQEIRETTPADRPGTGVFGPWREAYCEPPGAKSWGYDLREWPRRIEPAEVRRLIGGEVADYFAKHARPQGVSRWYNLTDQPFWSLGLKSEIPRAASGQRAVGRGQ